ncbi:MAG: formate--tetrahydrofolate ligase [Clostridia bacterium]|nr:formate--tetrahydrofolate ligase [Clostridia bacterium]
MTDIEIANATQMLEISEVAKKLGLSDKDIDPYGHYKAKINVKPDNKKGKLILVTAINPTSLGEGKTTTSIGLADGMAKIGKKVCLALREPSLGPVFGIKGGATGGGHAQVLPMEDINLNFTGDLHAITTANNLIAAILDNHIQQGNSLGIDVRRITWNRCVDLNDRALRNVLVGLGGRLNGVPREDHFNITAASEIMAVLCLSTDLMDLKKRVGDIIVAYNYDGKPVTCSDLKVQDAVAIVLKEAIKPNLVQTLEGTPAIIHGGPFANIAHGCNTVIATKLAMSLSDYTITEAGFGADLGAEKFLDIKCRVADIEPDCVCLVATIRALKYNGGKKVEFDKEDMSALQAGICNLLGHIDNLTNVFNANVVVAINKFITDTDKEIEFVKNECEKYGAKVVLCESWAKGSDGAVELAKTIVDVVDNNKKKLTYAYDLNDDIKTKIEKIATKVYGASRVDFTKQALNAIAICKDLGFDNYPVCIAKTQYSFSDDQTMLGRPKDFVFHVQDIQIRSGAKFIVAIAGSIMLMPGLGKNPAACNMEIDENNVIKGLF